MSSPSSTPLRDLDWSGPHSLENWIRLLSVEHPRAMRLSKSAPFFPKPVPCLFSEKSTLKSLIPRSLFLVMPLQDDYSEKWVRHLAEKTFSISVQSQEVKLLGIFAKSDSTQDRLFWKLAESAPKSYYDKYPMKSRTIDVRCDFGCYYPNATPGFVRQCEDIPADKPEVRSQCDARVAGCLSCIQRAGIRGQHPT